MVGSGRLVLPGRRPTVCWLTRSEVVTYSRHPTEFPPRARAPIATVLGHPLGGFSGWILNGVELVGTLTVPPPGMYRNLSEDSQQAIGLWLLDLSEQHEADGMRGNRKVGFWSHGPRQSGTTYLASVAVRRAVHESVWEEYGCIDWEYSTFADAVELVRTGWDETARLNPHDDGAWQDALRVERIADRLWKECDLLWLDDVHPGVSNMEFFGRHIFPKLEYRVKGGQATVVSTSFTPTQLGILAPVVEGLFVMCEPARAER